MADEEPSLDMGAGFSAEAKNKTDHGTYIRGGSPGGPPRGQSDYLSPPRGISNDDGMKLSILAIPRSTWALASTALALLPLGSELSSGPISLIMLCEKMSIL